MPVIKLLREFLVNPKAHNAWLHSPQMSVYVRKGRRRLERRHHSESSQLVHTLDIASVEVHEKCQGTWTRFIEEVQKLNPYAATYIECVHNPHLRRSLVRHGWKSAGEPRCFYKDTERATL